MTKKITVAEDRRNIRTVRKIIRMAAPAVRVVPADPSAVRDRWLARNPGLIQV